MLELRMITSAFTANDITFYNSRGSLIKSLLISIYYSEFKRNLEDHIVIRGDLV